MGFKICKTGSMSSTPCAKNMNKVIQSAIITVVVLGTFILCKGQVSLPSYGWSIIGTSSFIIMLSLTKCILQRQPKKEMRSLACTTAMTTLFFTTLLTLGVLANQGKITSTTLGGVSIGGSLLFGLMICCKESIDYQKEKQSAYSEVLLRAAEKEAGVDFSKNI